MRSVDDHVRNLVGRYCAAVSAADAEAFGDVWSESARWLMPGIAPVVGRRAIVEVFVRGRTTYDLCVQEILSGWVEPTGESSATASWQVRELQWRPHGAGSQLIGTYHDELAASTDGVWQFTQRRFELLYRGPAGLSGRLYRAESVPIRRERA